MESFGLWYKIKNDEYTNSETSNNDSHLEPQFSMHINFWSLEVIRPKMVLHKRKISSNEKYPYLDIGIEVNNFKCIQYIALYCPFDLGIEDIVDLSGKLSNKKNANLVFNNDCEIETKDNYTIINNDEKNNKIVVYPLNQVIDNVFKIESIRENKKNRIIISFEDFIKYIKQKPKFDDINNLYIRFRIKSKNLNKALYFDIEPMNKSFESAFIGTRVIDFKINEVRNIDDSVRAKALLEDEDIAKFLSIHFLIMEPSSYDLVSLSSNQSSCRELEEDVWNDYLGKIIDSSYGRILAYHWKKKASKKSGNECEDELIDDFSNLVKVNYSKANLFSIICYALIAILLGILGSYLYQKIIEIKIITNDDIKIVLVCIFVFLISFLMGKFKN